MLGGVKPSEDDELLEAYHASLMSSGGRAAAEYSLDDLRRDFLLTLGTMVSNDIAAVWVAFFSRRQRYRRGQVIGFVADSAQAQKTAELKRDLSGKGEGNFNSRADAIGGLRMFDDLVLRMLHYRDAGGWHAGLFEPQLLGGGPGAAAGGGGELRTPLLSS